MIINFALNIKTVSNRFRIRFTLNWYSNTSLFCELIDKISKVKKSFQNQPWITIWVLYSSFPNSLAAMHVKRALSLRSHSFILMVSAKLSVLSFVSTSYLGSRFGSNCIRSLVTTIVMGISPKAVQTINTCCPLR